MPRIFTTLALGLIGVGVLGVALASPLDRMFNVAETTITVTGKERITDQESSRYIVFAKEGEFEVTDTVIFWDWRASSRYNALEDGKTCRVKISGTRLGYLSRYPNVVEVYGCDEGTTIDAAEVARIFDAVKSGDIATPEAMGEAIERAIR